MGFTIEDMLVVSRKRYKMKLIAGEKGWSNSISFLMMLEDFTILHNFSGKELAVTTGLGFDTEEKQIRLVEELIAHNAAGLVVNTGHYIHEIPQRMIELCNENDLPLLTVPWEVILVDMVKDLSIRVFLQGTTDQQISQAFISAIENPGAEENYLQELLPFFDTDGEFQVFLITIPGLDKMDTVERRRLEYRLSLAITNLTHNGHFFYYDACFILITNAVSREDTNAIIGGFDQRIYLKMPDRRVYIGAGSRVTDIRNLHWSYHRAKAAVRRAMDAGDSIVYFDEMGVWQLLYLIDDVQLLKDFSEKYLGPLVEHDQTHGTNYVETLELYLNENESIKAVSEKLFTHRNTVLYRLGAIKKLIGCSLETEDEKLRYQMACMIRHMNLG